MREFYNDRGDYFEEEDENNQEVNEEESAEDVVDLANLDLIALGINGRILKMSIDLAASTWFWRFRSLDFKLKSINRIYHKFMELVSEE